jgi:hypothetical protein
MNNATNSGVWFDMYDQSDRVGKAFERWFSRLKRDSIYAITLLMSVVIDTNVFVSAVMSQNGASRQIIRLCLQRTFTPLMGNALFAEFEDVCSRDSLFDTRFISRSDRNIL